MKALYAILVLAAVGLAFVLSRTGGPNPGVDRYGETVRLQGTLYERPGSRFQAVLASDGSGGPATETYVLTSTGKSDAAELIHGLHGRFGVVTGTPITRANMRVLEVVSVEDVEEPTGELLEYVPLGAVELAGEIVDTKCAMGRMKPGDGVVHRECAIRCIRGGIAPTLMVNDGDGDARFYLLESTEGDRLNAAILPFVGDPVKVEGELFQWGDFLVLRLDPAQIERSL